MQITSYNNTPQLNLPHAINEVSAKHQMDELISEAFFNLNAHSAAFHAHSPFPTSLQRMKVVATTSKLQAEVVKNAINSYPIVPNGIKPLIDRFLSFKREQGSIIEQQLYAEMSQIQFIQRLIKQRPLMFMTATDQYLLRNGKSGAGGFDLIGSDEETPPLILREYLSYDEMQIAALISLSSPTHFINDGNRFNQAIPGAPDTYQPSGIYVGLVGARFERPGLMESQHMIISPTLNTAQNGYGANAADSSSRQQLQMWAQFYGIDYFPSYEEALQDRSGKFLALPNGDLLNIDVYKTRLKMVIEPFLIDAHQRAKNEQRKAYVHAVGIGLGVWQVSPEQAKMMLEVYAEVIAQNDLSHISDINFAWFPPAHQACGGIKDSETMIENGNRITIHFSKRNPAAKLTHQDADKLLVVSYAWDGNSFPGNEYWAGALTASGDPAAACCSMITELQNPYINPFLISGVGSKKQMIAANSIQ